MQHFRSFCHIIDYATLQLYDIFLAFQTHHIKEVKQYSKIVLKLYILIQSIYISILAYNQID
jgi:hypothetical protein